MVEITYSKGLYTMTDGVRTYTFNINNGHLINIRTLSRVQKPAFKKEDMRNALRKEYNCKNYPNMLAVLYNRLSWGSVTEAFNDNVEYLSSLSALDKIFNVMPKGYGLTHIGGIGKLSSKQLVKVINYVREYNNTDSDCIDLCTAINRLQIEELATTYGNLPVEFVREYKSTLQTFYNLGEEYRDIALYYFYNQKMYALRTDKKKYYGYCYGKEYILTYIECCKIMGKKPVKTNNFMREYIETTIAYDIWLETSKNERFLSHYERYKDNLTFSYGNYTVVLPKNMQDLVTEGNEMHHCVGSYGNRVADGETLIVFVRHKDTPDKCYITAQINPKNGELGQYYLAYDKTITNLEDREFKTALQVWLNSCQW